MIELKRIDRENFRPCVRLEVKEEQKNFVASNMYSIAQAYAEPECEPLAIYAGGELVAFACIVLTTRTAAAGFTA